MQSVDQILKGQRARYSLPIQKLSQFLYTPQHYSQMKRLFAQSPVVESSPNIFNQSRLDLIKNSYKYAPIKYNFYFKNPQFDDIHPHIKRQLHIFLNPNQTPGTMHEMMFNTYIEWFGREQHKKLHLKKALDLQILGCYAQTQIAHGSDISSLQTTATFSKETQQWVINSPTIQAAKFWPGDMGIVAQYAIVFAQAIVDSKSKGVFPFLVQIKDKYYNWMTGIDGGDIGPKIGFHTNENGFMLFNNVRIPRDDLINKYVQISQNGEIKNVGDPRVGFGAMMHVRQLITCVAMRNYAIPITIAVRYSLFRRQFRNGQKEEISIIEYQTQQDKILPRIAEYYAMSAGGTKIRLCSQANTTLIQKRDFSLLQETHANLALGKCLYTELVTDGCQILRRSVGGHGTSHYSGIPSVWSQSLANIPGEGQNTVMYIQTARYVMKNYLALLKGEPVAESLKYVSELGGVSDLQLSGKQEWTLKELRLTLLRGLQFVLGVVMSRLQSKSKEESTIDVMNHKLGNRLQQLAQLHAVIFTANAFVADIDAETHPSAKPILNDLCKLFMIGQIQRLSSPIIEAAFICPTKFALLEEEKQRIFARLRPIIVGLTDSLAIPEKYIRSQLARGHPYNNFLDAARQNDLNHGIQESQRICGNIAHVLAKQLPKL